MKKEETIQKHVRFKPAVWKQAEELADEKCIPIAKVLEESIQHLYSEDIIDENIILGRLSTLEKKLQYLDNRNETFSKLMMFLIEMIFCRLPDLPKETEQKKIIFEKNAKTMSQMLISFRKREQQEDIGFMQSVYGDMQEILEEEYFN